MLTLVVGATGLLGHEICRRLSDQGRPTRALIRPTADAGKRRALEQLGIELVEGDLKDEKSLARACLGTSAVVSTASATFSRQDGDSIESVDHRGQLALVEAAATAGVAHFVFVSFRDHPDVQYPLTVAKRAVEDALRRSGMDYTVLQASYFMEIWLSPALGFDAARGSVRLFGDGEGRVSWISYRDVARAVGEALVEPEARNRVIALGGPEALSQREVVRMFEAAGAGDISTQHVPQEALAGQLSSTADPLEQSFAGLMLQCARGDAVDPAASSIVTHFSRTTVRDFVAAHMAQVERRDA